MSDTQQDQAQEQAHTSHIDDLPQYVTSEGEAREYMDAIINAAATNPDDINAILAWGTESLDKLNSASQDAEKHLKKSASLAESIDAIFKDFSEIDFDEYTGRAKDLAAKGINTVRKNPMKSLATGTALVVLGPFAAAGVGGAAALHGKITDSKKHPLDKFIKDVQIISAKTGAIKKSLKDADGQIPNIISSIHAIATARGQNYQELGIYVAAGIEYRRRLADEIIPAANDTYTQSPTNDNMEFLQNLQMSHDQLDNRITDLLSARGISLLTAGHLFTARQELVTCAARVKNHLGVNAPQWDSLGVIAGNLNLAGKIQKLDSEATSQTIEMLDKMSALQGQMKLAGEANQTASRNAQKRIATHLETEKTKISTSLGNTSDQLGKNAEIQQRLANSTSDLATVFRQRSSALPLIEGKEQTPAIEQNNNTADTAPKPTNGME